MFGDLVFRKYGIFCLNKNYQRCYDQAIVIKIAKCNEN